LIAFFLVLWAFSGPAQEPSRHPGFYMDSDEDLKTAPLSFYLWFGYKYFHPVKTAAVTMENFFKSQDLNFGQSFAQTQVQSRAKIVAVGDMMVKTRMTRQNSAHLFNLEGPSVPNQRVSAFPKYNYRPELVKFFKEQGFDVFSTANNHSLDQGPEGLKATLDYLDQLGVRHHGTARTPEERDQGIPILEAGGIKVAFLSYTYGTNGRSVPKGKEWLVNVVDFNAMGNDPDLSLVQKDIQAARKMGAEVVVVVPHWGLEYEYFPPERIVSRAHQIIEMGADIILGYHPHCLQPMERYLPKNPDRIGLPEAFIIYSLGNFIPDHFQVDFRTSVVLGIELASGNYQGKKQIWIDKIELTPIYFYSGKEFRLVRIDQALEKQSDPGYSFLKSRDYKNLEQAQKIIQELFLPQNSSLEKFLPRP